ncbi:MAG: zinc-binding dehydrogenase [Clostridium sp.]|jgi:threonine dehydrogenase-like Zn-dependent dehydrogenase|uniref:zinc-binding dehydrogenase n=1 Tax=Clostridium sp. TaxID=1506 RepID=UPI0025C5F918|nr:zinc-binding dehydrogenase [Clostridium sp.]MCH3964832.1 zinc-binding dehydrogenase [Clostridium sp.]MCI1717386.1 zinc-binding dehydrogenase [Clostridium sp.]MCI1801726.1 zinc-binding dehydrogenase [Clostridium sp.]MCI1814850.1 zinc-binding dehydrogenase [Clostridium sp.]MCI1872474.1 zinc-binding dehydrogenase [Clostridium sp.]
MKTRAVRLYGKNDLRLEEFELPEIKDDEILVKVVSDSICMSTYKAAVQGPDHKRVPKDVDKNPVIVGHEFAGDIIKVGNKWRGQFEEGGKFAQQPALNYKGSMASPGYSYKYFGGDATYMIIPHEVMELGCLLNYNGDSYYEASLAEPMSCIIGAYHACFHTKMGSYHHEMGIKKGGKLVLLAAAGPMGLGAVEYVINCDRRPSLLVVTDIDDARIKRAEEIFDKDKIKSEKGIDIEFVNTKNIENSSEYLIKMTGGTGFDDVYAYTPVRQVVEEADRILGRDGCLNFFAGPTDKNFSGELNYYNVHYGSTHVIGTTGGNTDDLKESLRMTEEGSMNPAVMVTHIGGLNCVPETTLNLPNIPGGKKLIYTNINMELTAIDDFEEKGRTDPLFAELAKITRKHNGLWSTEAEKYLLDTLK